ncbi:MAG: hypothetical protein R2761_10385 [Acidimicrobiales bacterium]
MSDVQPDEDSDLDAIEQLIRTQLGPESFVNLEVVRNRRYELIPAGSNRVVPFQVRAFRQQQAIAGLAPSGRSTVFEGVAISRDTPSGTVWDLYADSLTILTDLGVPIAIRPPLPQSPGQDAVPVAAPPVPAPVAPASAGASVPSTAGLAAGLTERRYKG